MQRLWRSPSFRQKNINARKGSHFQKVKPDKRTGKTYTELYGQKRAMEIRKKQRLAAKGRVPLNRVDPILKRATDAKISATVKKRFASDPDYRRRCLSSARPTSLESAFSDFAKSIGLPVKYVGNGGIWIGNMNPDFIDSTGKLVCYELFGRKWHEKEEEKQRIERFKAFGWACIVIWDRELNNKIKLLNKLKEESNCENICNINYHLFCPPN